MQERGHSPFLNCSSPPPPPSAGERSRQPNIRSEIFGRTRFSEHVEPADVPTTDAEAEAEEFEELEKLAIEAAERVARYKRFGTPRGNARMDGPVDGRQAVQRERALQCSKNNPRKEPTPGETEDNKGDVLSRDKQERMERALVTCVYPRLVAAMRQELEEKDAEIARLRAASLVYF